MRKVVSLVFGIREAKLTIVKDEGGKVDFFISQTRCLAITGRPYPAQAAQAAGSRANARAHGPRPTPPATPRGQRWPMPTPTRDADAAPVFYRSTP